ncbi:glycogenin glucosyltransferase, putative [Bodo saltans]|uniref:Glycogenin glucosyltransferase, putative n=1 Tax=Bodo saltans TaxID=75058 RepID=A0A0S4J2A0_BODSA|nr:glycogenin glucosyltransferase, putative [Bodo saltans]|eukprot:CUG53605.1 glycogenin glucosyltransferase, putative [Bodo saltans]
MGTSFWNQSHLVQIGNATLVAIVPKGAVSAESIERLQLAGWSHVLQVEDLTKYAAPKSHYAATFNKLYLFNLTEYHRVATFDVDMLMLRNPDGVFRTHLTDDQWIGALGNSHRKNHSYFQTGMMLIVPSAKSFQWLMDEFRNNPHQRDMNGRDGRLIRDYFKDRYVNLDSALSAHLGIHEPLDSVIGFHYRGEFKPWFNKEFPPNHPAYGDRSGKIMEQELGEAYRMWWAAYELLHRTKLAEHDLGPKRATDIPAGYNSAKTVWLMRHTSRSYLQTLSDVDIAERNRTYPGLRIEVGDAGKSCDETCANQQSVCRQDALSFAEVNHCDLLKKVFGCHKCTMNYPGSEEPAYDVLTRVCYRNPLDYKAQRPTCNATMSGHERLCPCVPIENAYDHSKPYDGIGFPIMALLKAKEKSVEPPLEPPGLHTKSGCFPTKADYFGSDGKCVAYLKDLNNVAWVSVLGRASLVGRTVKMMLHYHEPNIKAVVKFPQKTFPHEAHSEVASYTVDRVLGVHRVPPTAFTYFPLDRLRATLTNATAENTDPNMKSSLAELSVELLEFLVQQGVGDLVRKADGSESLEVGVSAQLWMDDVHRLADSIMRDAAVEPQAPHHHNNNAPPSALALYFKKHSTSKPHEAALLELSRMLVFDFIIGNDDRTPTKNTFVLGGCQGPHCGPGRSAYRFEGLHPQIALVDQGRSFYFVGNPEDNALSTPQAHDVCVFPKELIETCLNFSHNRTAVGSLRRADAAKTKAKDSDEDPFSNTATLERALFTRLPKEVQTVLHEDAIHAAQDRLERLLNHVDGCMTGKKGSSSVEHVLRSP